MQTAAASLSPAPVFRVRALADFKLIHAPDVSLVLLERRLPDETAQWIDGLDLSAFTDIADVFGTETLAETLPDALGRAGLAPAPGRSAFAADIAGLAAAYCALTGKPRVHLRLEAVSGNACWKFHRDFVRLRLVTTYRGPGTEWVPPAQAAEALQAQTAYAGPLERFPLHAAGLFKGSLDGQEQGVVHRSPPIEGTGQKRLFLCLNDPPEDA